MFDNEVTHSGSLDSFRLRSGPPKYQPLVTGLEFESTQTQEREGRLELEFSYPDMNLMKHAYITNP